MIAYVYNERRRGLSVPFGIKVEEHNRNNSIKACSIRVKCLNDNKEFRSMMDAAKFYNISKTSIYNSIQYNKPVLCRKQNQKYQFVRL